MWWELMANAQNKWETTRTRSDKVTFFALATGKERHWNTESKNNQHRHHYHIRNSYLTSWEWKAATWRRRSLHQKFPTISFLDLAMVVSSKNHIHFVLFLSYSAARFVCRAHRIDLPDNTYKQRFVWTMCCWFYARSKLGKMSENSGGGGCSCERERKMRAANSTKKEEEEDEENEVVRILKWV